MKRWLIGVGVGIALLVVAAIAALLTPGISRNGFESIATRVVGQPVTVAGAFRVSLLPRFGVIADDVRVLGSIGSPDVARIKRIETDLSILSLLAARIEVGKLIVTEPVIRIAPPPARATKDPRSRDWRPRPNPDWGILRSARIGEGRVINGHILYADTAAGRRLEADRIEAKLAMPIDGGPFTAEGTARVNSRPVTWKFDGSGMQRLLAGGGMKVSAEARSDLATFDFQGNIARRQLFVLDGRVNLAAPSATAFDRWIGPWLAAPVEGPLDVQGRLVLSGARFAVEQVNLTLGEMRARGEAAAVFTGGQAAYSLHVAAEVLDVTPFLFVGKLGGASRVADSGPGSGDSDIKVDWQAIKLGHLRGGPGKLAIKGERKTGIAEAELGISSVFGGEITMRSRFTADQTGGTLEGRAVLARLQVESILGPIVGDPPLAGSLNGTISLAAPPGAGSVMERLVVNGTATMSASKVLSARLAEKLEPTIGNGRELTDLAFRFATSTGQVGFEDVVVRGISGSLVGGGALNLADGGLDMTLRRPSSEGQTNGIRISGPWDGPDVTLITGETPQ